MEKRGSFSNSNDSIPEENKCYQTVWSPDRDPNMRKKKYIKEINTINKDIYKSFISSRNQNSIINNQIKTAKLLHPLSPTKASINEIKEKKIEEQKSNISAKKSRSFFSIFNIFSCDCKSKNNISCPKPVIKLESYNQRDNRRQSNTSYTNKKLNESALSQSKVSNCELEERNQISPSTNKRAMHQSVIIKVSSTQKSIEVSPGSDPSEISESNSNKFSSEYYEEPHTNEDTGKANAYSNESKSNLQESNEIESSSSKYSDLDNNSIHEDYKIQSEINQNGDIKYGHHHEAKIFRTSERNKISQRHPSDRDTQIQLKRKYDQENSMSSEMNEFDSEDDKRVGDNRDSNLSFRIPKKGLVGVPRITTTVYESKVWTIEEDEYLLITVKKNQISCPSLNWSKIAKEVNKLINDAFQRNSTECCKRYHELTKQSK